MADDTAGTNRCKCGCGTLVRGEWARGHWARGEGGGTPEPLPSPGEDDGLDGLDDLGEIDLDEPGGPYTAENDPDGSRERVAAMAGAVGRDDWWEIPVDRGEPVEAPAADPPPARIGKGAKAGKSTGKPARVTAAVRGDIHAKIRFMAVPLVNVWAMRDPVCGGTAVQAEPEISAALLDIVLHSPDLIEFFTGPVGGFMIYLRLAMALLPVVQVAYAHHVAHTIEGPEQAPNATVDPARYAA